MSTNNQRVVSAIRRLAKSDPDIRNAISATRNKGDQAGSSSSASSEGEASRACCDGSTGPVNAGITQSDPDSGGQDASSGLDPNDPAKLDMGAGSLTGLTDCATGEPVCFDGDQWVLPDGWDDVDDPPVVPGYVEGVYWEGWSDEFGLPRKSFHTCSEAYEYAISASDCEGPGNCSNAPNGGSWGGQCEGSGSYQYSFQKYSCENSQDPICDEPPPLAEAWPADGCVNLKIAGGSIVGSKYDPENDGTYSAPMAERELCDQFGNKVGIKPAATGLFKTINATTGEDGYLYNAQGEQIAHIDGAEYSDPNI